MPDKNSKANRKKRVKIEELNLTILLKMNFSANIF